MQEALRRIAKYRRAPAGMLDLEELGLRSLPEGVRTLGHLEALNLRHNRLTTLPSWIAELRQLERLSLLALQAFEWIDDGNTG
jgi:Leucine-rich repeat (LRR) protein